MFLIHFIINLIKIHFQLTFASIDLFCSKKGIYNDSLFSKNAKIYCLNPGKILQTKTILKFRIILNTCRWALKYTSSWNSNLTTFGQNLSIYFSDQTLRVFLYKTVKIDDKFDSISHRFLYSSEQIFDESNHESFRMKKKT